MQEIVTSGGEIIQDFSQDSSALAAQLKAEIDVQISTAKRYPRSLERFMRDAMGMVSYDADLAGKCTFNLPRGGKKIAGPSVRLAEMLAVCWGNLRIMGRVIDQNDRFITSQGIALDLEKNVGYQMDVQRSIVYAEGDGPKAGKTYNTDMIVMTGNAATAIATRNATFKVIPLAFVHAIWERSKAVARGDEATLGARAQAALKWFGEKGISEARVCAALGIVGFADISIDQLMELNGFRNAINEGHATLDEIFPPDIKTTSTERKPGESKVEAMARTAKEKAAKTETKTEPPAKTPPAETKTTEAQSTESDIGAQATAAQARMARAAISDPPTTDEPPDATEAQPLKIADTPKAKNGGKAEPRNFDNVPTANDTATTIYNWSKAISPTDLVKTGERLKWKLCEALQKSGEIDDSWIGADGESLSPKAAGFLKEAFRKSPETFTNMLRHAAMTFPS